MKTSYIAQASMDIKVPVSKVWQALTDPAIVKQYFFGVDLITDWKVGSPIIYKGEWEGKPFEDKGNVLEVVPEKLLVTNYRPGSSKLPDVVENYNNVRYELEPIEGGTKVTVIQDNNPTEEGKQHSEANWNFMLGAMKKLLEK